ncbi:hypothetical protein H4582DRAFT_195291 [Lactarius indigo]|nr:hypothetical protein H4582DRAFT_195291 [Lactarius indigo]
MPGYSENVADPEQGEPSGGEAWSLEECSYRNSGGGATGDSSSEGPFPAGPQKGRRDFDDGANALWTLYGKEAKTHDEARFQRLAADMDGIPTFAGLFAAVLTSFLVQSIQTLQVNPVEQSAYYQQQSVAILAQISQQLASITPQVPTAPAPPPPYPAFCPSDSNIRVNIYWVIGLVCSLSAALLATVVQQWVRSYMQVFQRYDNPLKRARFRQFFFEGADGMRTLAGAVNRLIQFSLLCFFLGLGDSMINANLTVGVATIIPICGCGSFYLYSVSAPLRNLQSPHQNLFSRLIFFLIQKFPRSYSIDRFSLKRRTHTSIEAYQEQLVMEETDERKDRDVRAVRWLVDNTAVTGEMEPLVEAMPDSFDTEWGREVWMDVSSQWRSHPGILESLVDRSAANGPSPLIHQSPRPLEGTAADTICRCVRYLLYTCKTRSYFPSEEARSRRMRACVEATASLVCGIGFRLEWFGEVGKLVSEIGHIEKINQSPTTTSDPSFSVRWTCLSLVAIQQILRSNRLQVLAGYAVSGLARFRSEYGQPDEAAWKSAQRIAECLKTARERIEELCRAFEPLSQKRTREQVLKILRNHESQISELERIKVEADNMEDVDWRISLYQDAMDDATYKLTRQLPGVSFDEPPRNESSPINDTFNTPVTGSDSVTPQLIFPGRRVQALARLGLKLREVLDGQVADGPKGVLETLKSVDQVRVSLRRPYESMKRQLWRLQDLRDGDGLGFTVELFFLSLRQLLSIPSLPESNSVFYIGTFRIITSHWENGRESLGSQHILLNVICDLIIRDRGVFSDISYPEPITSMLFDTVGDMLQGYAGPDEHIRDAVREIKGVDPRSCMDLTLQRRALTAIHRYWQPQSSNPIHVVNSVS